MPIPNIDIMRGSGMTEPTSVQESVLEANRLRRFARTVFERAGMPPDDADILAEQLVWADLRGIPALGVAKIPQYLPRLRMGGTAAVAEPSLLAEKGGFLVFDGHDGFGQVVGFKVMRQVVQRAHTTGISSAVVRNTTSAGALGRFAMQAVDEQMIGLAINNGPVLMTAPGGADKVVGNQAFAIASPAGNHHPIVLDMAVSGIAMARIHEYEARGEDLPPGLAVTVDGLPTVDPAEALKGSLVPMGGHRGFGLAFMWEMLTGILSGGPGFTTELGWPAESAKPQGVSMLLIAIDPSVSIPYTEYAARADQLVDRIHDSRAAAGSGRPTVPGERSVERMARRQADGIPIPAKLLTELTNIAEEAGVTL
ncbi:Ldh family oxidoreductase [Kribbella sp. NPDC049227]|uniref:Ldh family oxidoreductase n=1 Tax=Kribbella sp. NPDC049227 TaxID=3364113 RepID=UPI00371CA404